MIFFSALLETAGEDTELSLEDAFSNIYDSLKLDSLNGLTDYGKMGFTLDTDKVLSSLMHGDMEYVIKAFFAALKNGLIGEAVANKNLMVELITIVLIGSVFVNISNSFGQSFISENGFYVTYLIMTAIMLTSFAITMDMVVSSLSILLNLIRGIVPVFALAMNYVGNSTQAAGMYTIVLVCVWIVQLIIIKFILPMIKFYVIISMINNLNKEDNFSKLCELIRNIVTWLLKTIVVFVVGLNIIKGLIEPQIDAIGKNTVSKISSAIPGGSVMSVLTGTFLGAGMVIKNSIGVLGIVLLALAALIPVIKVFFIMFAIKLTGAIIQPVGDKRYTTGFDTLGKGMGLLIEAVFCSVVMFMLTIAIVSFSGG